MLVHVADGGHHLVEDLQDITLFQLPEKNVRLEQKLGVMLERWWVRSGLLLFDFS